MSELWLIHAPLAATQLQHIQVSLCHTDGERWQSNTVHPGADFLGSAEFLDSVSQPDTEVVLLLDKEDGPERHEAELWVSLEDSPPRLNYATLKGFHLHLIAQLKHLGVNVQVIGRKSSGAPEWAQVYVRVDRRERAALEQWVQTRLRLTQSRPEKLHLAFYLLLKTGLHRGGLALISALLMAMTYLCGSAGLEALELQKRKLNTQHQSQIQQLEQSGKAAESKIDWAWLGEVLKGLPPGVAGPNSIAFQWNVQDGIELWLLGHSQKKNQGSTAGLSAPSHPDCKRTRTGDLLCRKTQGKESGLESARLKP